MPMVGLFTSMNISASGLRAQRVRQNVIASNIANVETTRTPEGGPYRKQTVLLEADPKEIDQRFVFPPPQLKGDITKLNHMPIPNEEFPINREYIGSGVKVVAIEQDSTPPKLIYDPTHPDANGQGYVAMPNVNIVQEMTDMITASRAYEANVTAFNAAKQMHTQALDIA
jgi:flagellar basal-body rod protein FlgC